MHRTRFQHKLWWLHLNRGDYPRFFHRLLRLSLSHITPLCYQVFLSNQRSYTDLVAALPHWKISREVSEKLGIQEVWEKLEKQIVEYIICRTNNIGSTSRISKKTRILGGCWGVALELRKNIWFVIFVYSQINHKYDTFQFFINKYSFLNIS